MSSDYSVSSAEADGKQYLFANEINSELSLAVGFSQQNK